MATFPEMRQYVELDEANKQLEGENQDQILKQPKFGWCARVCLDIAMAYALQKTIRNLNEVNPNLTRRIELKTEKVRKHSINILKGGFAEQIYNNQTQWENGGLFRFEEVDINSCIKSVMTKNNLRERADGKKRLAPVFTEHKEGTITLKLSKVVKFLEEETKATIGMTYSGLRVCFLQFYNSKKDTRHECIVCGTNKEQRKLNPELVPTIDIYNPWGHITEDVEPNNLYSIEKAVPKEIERWIRKIFNLDPIQIVNYSLESVRLFSFKWWK